MRSLIGVASTVVLGLALGGCRSTPTPLILAQPNAPRPTTLPEQVVYDFEQATLTSRDAYVGLFDFTAVGVFEILLRRYDLLGRLPDLSEAAKADLAKDDGTPYPAERERRNVGNFYKYLAQRTVGTGGCTAGPPVWAYGQQLGVAFEPLPEAHAHYEPLRLQVNGWLAKGGVIGIQCRGGQRGLALVYTASANLRGYDLITIYDDAPRP